MIHSINIRGPACVGEGCSGPGVGVKLNLTGEVIGEFLGGVPCTTNVLTLTGDNVNTFDGKNEDGSEDLEEKKNMGACYKVLICKGRHIIFALLGQENGTIHVNIT